MTGRIRVLCVEDDPTAALVVREALAEADTVNFEVECLDTLATATRRAAADAFDVVLLDLNLPDSRGLDTVEAMHAAAPTVPIVVLTVLDDAVTGMRAVEHGADDYLVKGRFDASSLSRALHYASERRRARLKLEAASRAKDEFLALVAHEFRTPLSAMLSWTELLQLGTVDEAKVRRAATVIDRNARSLAHLIEDLLDQARIATGKMRIASRPCDLRAIAAAALDGVRLAASAKGITLETALATSGDGVVGDPDRLQQVVWNLLTNAIKFTPEGGTVSIALRREGRYAILEVSDTGCGIEPDMLPHVFARFAQAKTLPGRAVGLGLGLSLVRELVELHGGTVSAASGGEGHGATFRISLPLSADGVAAADDAPSLQGVQIALAGGTDEEREALGLLLQQNGASIRSAETLDEIVTMARRRRPHVVLVDAGLPGRQREALDAVLRYARSGPLEEVPVVAITALQGEDEALALHEAGYARHLVKPVTAETLLPLLASVTGRGGRRWDDRHPT